MLHFYKTLYIQCKHKYKYKHYAYKRKIAHFIEKIGD